MYGWPEAHMLPIEKPISNLRDNCLVFCMSVKALSEIFVAWEKSRGISLLGQHRKPLNPLLIGGGGRINVADWYSGLWLRRVSFR